MTTPTERMRNLVQAGALLKEIRANESVPERIRKEADRLLRHYPTVSELKSLATDSGMLAAEINDDWLRNSRFGAHK